MRIPRETYTAVIAELQISKLPHNMRRHGVKSPRTGPYLSFHSRAMFNFNFNFLRTLR